MAQQDPTARQACIVAEMHVGAGFDAAEEIKRRVAFLANLRGNGLKT